MTRRLPKYSDAVDALKPWARIELIALDLDGTLIESEDRRVFENLRALCTSLRHPRYRVTITVATGRAFSGAQPLLHELELPAQTPVVLYNGSLVYQRRDGVALHRAEMGPDVLTTVLGMSDPSSVVVLAYYAQFVQEASVAPSGLVERVSGWATHPPYETEVNSLPINWNQPPSPDREPIAILVESSSPDLLLRIEKKLQTMPSASATRSGPRFLEIRPEGSNKGVALAALTTHLRVPQENVLAVGDADNDSEMLRWAGTSVAIRGATTGAMASAGFVSEYGAARGAVEVLRIVRSARRYFAEHS